MNEPENELIFDAARKNDENGTIVDFDRHYMGIKVLNKVLRVHFNNKGQIEGFHGHFGLESDISSLPLTPLITSDKAVGIARKNSNLIYGSITAELIIYAKDIYLNGNANNKSEQYLLAWQIVIDSKKSSSHFAYVIDAKDGSIILKDDGIRY